ncbi:MAG: SepM family pheromone-processing serine protease [Bacillota bacterium]
MRKRFWIVLIAILLVAANFYMANNYTIVAPGVTVDLKEIVEVEEGVRDEEGAFLLTTVSTRPLNLPLAIYAAFNPFVDIEPSEQVIPEGMDMKKYMEYMKQWMQESQKIAEVVALRRAGYETEIRGNGAKVVEVMEDSPAKGLVQPEDIIVGVDGVKVNLAEEVINLVTKHKIGDKVNLKIIRNGEELTLTVPTMESKTEKGKPIIGVFITTLDWKPILPLDININTGDIGGPSAGLMFTLEILNQLTPGDLTRGHKIAGTGTISLDESVGEIGGVVQKVAAAKRDGAEIFFVPENNAEEAREAAENLGIKLVPVRTLQDVLDYLENL